VHVTRVYSACIHVSHGSWNPSGGQARVRETGAYIVECDKTEKMYFFGMELDDTPRYGDYTEKVFFGEVSHTENI